MRNGPALAVAEPRTLLRQQIVETFCHRQKSEADYVPELQSYTEQQVKYIHNEYWNSLVLAEVQPVPRRPAPQHQIARRNLKVHFLRFFTPNGSLELFSFISFIFFK